MLALRSLLKIMVLPPFLNIAIGLLGLLILNRYPRLGRSLIAVSLLSIYLMSTSLVSGGVSALNDIYEPVDLTKAAECEAIVILSGGTKEYAPEYKEGQTTGVSSLVRVRYGVKLARELGLPVLVTGGVGFGALSEGRRPEAELMAIAMKEQFQLPAKWVETESRNTFENGALTKKVLAPEGINNIVLVTQSFHMRRSVEVFASLGFNVMPAPTEFYGVPTSLFSIRSYIPRIGNFQVSTSVMSETVGRFWYWLTAEDLGSRGVVGSCDVFSL